MEGAREVLGPRHIARAVGYSSRAPSCRSLALDSGIEGTRRGCKTICALPSIFPVGLAWRAFVAATRPL